MVDRCQRWNFQNGTGQDRQSKRHLCCQRQDLGRAFKRDTWRQVGLLHRPLESSRQSKPGEKARRNFSLEFRLKAELEIRRWIQLCTSIGAEKVKLAEERVAGAADDPERLYSGVFYLNAGAILVVLHHGVMQLQLLFRSYNIV